MRKNKIFFFFFIFLISPLILSSIPNVQAQTPEYKFSWVNIDNTWISVSPGTFQDSSPGDGSGALMISSGGYKLKSFQNEGLVQTEDDGTVVYRSSAKFGFAVQWCTMVDNRKAFPNANFDKITTKPYVRVNKYLSNNIYDNSKYGLNGLQEIYGTIEYRECVLGDFMAHDYNGITPITVSIHEDFSDWSVMINDKLFSNPSVYAEVKKVSITDIRGNNVADYNDLYTDNTVNEGGITVREGNPNAPNLGAGAGLNDVTAEINKMNIGWHEGTYSEGITVTSGAGGQSQVYGGSVGQYWDNPARGLSSNSMTFNMRVQVKPEVTYTQQSINVRYAELGWDYEDVPVFSPSKVEVMEGPYDQWTQRIASVHVKNQMVTVEYEADVNFLAEAKLVGAAGGVNLEDPFLEYGDWVWDESTTGTTGMEITHYQPGQDFLNSLGIGFMTSLGVIAVIAIIIIIGYLFLTRGLPTFIKNMRKRD